MTVRRLHEDGTPRFLEDGVTESWQEGYAPTAVIVADPTSTTNPLTAIDLDGTGSTDSDGTIVSYLWELVSAPDGYTGTFDTPTASTCTFTPVENIETAILADNPTRYWRFEEVSGSTVEDEIGSADLTVTGADLTGVVRSELGSGATFDGTDDFASVNSVCITGFPFTIEAWVKTTDTAGVIYFEGNGGSNEQFLCMRISSGQLRAQFRDSGTAPSSGNYTINDGNPHQCVLVAHSATDGDLWVDGVKRNDGLTNAGTLGTIANHTRSAVGCLYRASPADFLAGQIDEVAVWNGTALADASIQAHYAAGAP